MPRNSETYIMGFSNSLEPHNPDQDGFEVTSSGLPGNYSRLIASISARLVKVPSENLDAEIVRSLKEALQPLGVDRGGLLDLDEESQILRLSHAWYGDGITHVSGDINLAELFPFAYREIVVEGRTVAVSNCEDIPVEAEVDRKTQELFGIKSRLTIPLFIGNRVHHMLSVDALKAECAWHEDVITHLRLLGEIFVSALQRREADEALCQSEKRLDLAASSADAGLWELDLVKGQFWATDKSRQLFGFAGDTAITLDNFLEKIHVEDRPLIVDAIEALSHDHRELSVEYRSPDVDGNVRWMHSRGRRSEANGNKNACLTGVTMDISCLKQMEVQLHEQLLEVKKLRDQLEKENLYLRNEAEILGGAQQITCISSSMHAIIHQVEQVAKTGSTVLIQGETGTGKEVIAQTIHQLSERRKRVMVKVNCAALPAALVESELFGRERGAFTGALSKQAGRFELADGSTLFLDEVAEMSLETQAKLLRVLQEGEFERLGSPQTIKVDVRLIAASNRDLLEAIAQGRFRRDLYYRLNVFPIRMPPLRERTDDIPHLVWEIVNELGERMGRKIRRISSKDMEVLKAYDWPGNIRELRNVIEHALITSDGDILRLQRLSDAASRNEEAMTLKSVEHQHILAMLKTTSGRIKGTGGAAERLGLHPSTLYSRMRKLGIKAT